MGDHPAVDGAAEGAGLSDGAGLAAGALDGLADGAGDALATGEGDGRLPALPGGPGRRSAWFPEVSAAETLAKDGCGAIQAAVAPRMIARATAPKSVARRRGRVVREFTGSFIGPPKRYDGCYYCTHSTRGPQRDAVTPVIAACATCHMTAARLTITPSPPACAKPAGARPRCSQPESRIVPRPRRSSHWGGSPPGSPHWRSRVGSSAPALAPTLAAGPR
jgi:hypothetical protein